MLKLVENPTSRRTSLRTRVPLSPEKRVTQKYRKAHIRKLKAKEYKRLRAVLPSLANKNKVNRVTVIEEAIKYIDELHRALMDRIHTENDEPVKEESVIQATHQMFREATPHPVASTSSLPILTERNRSVPDDPDVTSLRPADNMTSWHRT